MKTTLLPFLFAAMAFASQSASAQDSDHLMQSKAKLIDILSCATPAEPAQVFSLVRSLGGIAIINNASQQNYDFTLPNSIEMYGREINRITIHPGSDNYGDYHEYGAIFDNESVENVARIADIPFAEGKYLKRIGNHDLTIRPELGVTYIVCANHVRTLWKSVKHLFKHKPQ